MADSRKPPTQPKLPKKEGEGGRRPEDRSPTGEVDPEQYQRFLDAAREHGCEKNIGRLDEVVRRTAKLPSRREAARKRVKTEAKN
jgi:hypothetical protein